MVAYVVDVKDEASYQKEDKTFTVKEAVLADPISKITMNVMLWRWKEIFGPEMIGKVIIFSRFILKEYK